MNNPIPTIIACNSNNQHHVYILGIIDQRYLRHVHLSLPVYLPCHVPSLPLPVLLPVQLHHPLFSQPIGLPTWNPHCLLLRPHALCWLVLVELVLVELLLRVDVDVALCVLPSKHLVSVYVQDSMHNSRHNENLMQREEEEEGSLGDWLGAEMYFPY